MKIRVLWAGKTKEPYARAGIEKYLRLTGHFVEVEVIELKEEKGRPPEIMRKNEGRRTLDHTSAFALMDECGRAMDSKAFAAFMASTQIRDFVLGGAYGVSEEVKSRASATISLSPMTFPHELARVVFLEQLYRAFTINAGRGYHH